jgi:AcrR family transcriptional regulator
LRAARRLFAERGFYGASIASIAAELGLTKQALIHHFGTKERLYGEVLAQMARRLSGAVERARSSETAPERQLEALFLRLYANAVDHPEDTQLIMRELLDNRPRAEQAQSWHLKDFLGSMAAMVRKASTARALSETEALARVYLALGAFNFFVISEPTLTQMYGAAGFSALKDEFPVEIRRLVRTFFGAA